MAIQIDGKNMITISGKVTAYNLQSSFITQTNKLARKLVASDEIPIISIAKVSWFDAEALPIFLSIGGILRDFFGQIINLILPEADEMKQFLAKTRFYDMALDSENKGENQIFYFDIHEAYSYEIKTNFNPKNKIEKFAFFKDYYLLPEDQRKKEKYRLQDHYRQYLIGHQFGRIINDKIDGEDKFDDCMDALSEIVCNAVLYSESFSYVGVQVLKSSKYSICVSDTGIGFKESLERKEISPLESVKYVKHESLIENEYLDDFFAFFTALKYSEKQERYNLWKLIHMICENNGTIYIHTNRVEVRFDKNTLISDVYSSMNYIVDHYSSDYDRSAMWIYQTKLRGVRIRIIF